MGKVALLAGVLIALAVSALAAPAPPGGREVIYLPGFDRGRVVGEERMVVRAYTSASADRQEVAGARCSAVSAELSVDFTTPATLIVPRIAKRPSDLQIKCRSWIGAGQRVVRPAHPDHRVPLVTPFIALAATVLATGLNEYRDHWTYVSVDQTRGVVLHWATRRSPTSAEQFREDFRY